MSADFDDAFNSLRPVLARYAGRLAVQTDTPTEYSLIAKRPSPFPQHKGNPLPFAAVRVGKAYVSFHLVPVYMCPELNKGISPGLKKRMQGKSCFNFKAKPEPALLAELKRLTEAGFKRWRENKWA